MSDHVNNPNGSGGQALADPQVNLSVLRPLVEKAINEALAQRETGPKNPGGDSAYAALLAFAETGLRGKGRRVVEIVCRNGGEYPLADLALDPGVEWNAPWEDAWESLRRRVNAKLKAAGQPYRLIRDQGKARIQTLPKTVEKDGSRR
jgi:hypothetical protein